MKYIYCNKCGRYVPPEYDKCPHCGSIVFEKKYSSKLKRLIKIILRREH